MKPIRDEVLDHLVQKKLVQRKLSEIDFLKREELNWGESHHYLMDDIYNNGYKPNNNHPTISKDNIAMDGNHRLVILHELYGDNYVVTLRFVNTNYNRLILRGGLCFIWVSIKRFFRRLFKRK